MALVLHPSLPIVIRLRLKERFPNIIESTKVGKNDLIVVPVLTTTQMTQAHILDAQGQPICVW